jgi:hypothetical protein
MMLLKGADMRIGMYVTLAIIIMVTGALLPPDVYARGGHHGHGHHRGHGFHGGHNSLHIGLGFVFPLYSSYGYPYYAPAPVYAVPAQLPPPTVTPSQRSYTATQETSEYCREYTKKVLVDGKEEMAYGTACLQDDGRWRIMN